MNKIWERKYLSFCLIREIVSSSLSSFLESLISLITSLRYLNTSAISITFSRIYTILGVWGNTENAEGKQKIWKSAAQSKLRSKIEKGNWCITMHIIRFQPINACSFVPKQCIRTELGQVLNSRTMLLLLSFWFFNARVEPFQIGEELRFRNSKQKISTNFAKTLRSWAEALSCRKGDLDRK